ncbi:MAG: glycosyltransferase family 39 protein [Bacteroidales bacterium]|nr:glycosyltransferase family 39 protein [Bacteroidales bacterium]MBR1799447.1 glycosyltransferase family 39 protein [Bacteroidales bacterium]
MIDHFPPKIANTAIYIYLGTLAAVSLLYRNFAMSWQFMAIGIMWVVLFFVGASQCSRRWASLPERRFLLYITLTAFLLRVAWVLFSYYFYIAKTGIPFEFETADAVGYYEQGIGFSTLPIGEAFRILFLESAGVSDSGYIFLLSLLSRITGYYIIPARIVKSAFSAATLLFLYPLAKRNIGENGARIATTLACFMPNLIYYCGLHLKETIMIFCLIAFLDQADRVLRNATLNVFNIVLAIFFAISLFTFRTVLGIAALFAFASALLFSDKAYVGKRRRIILIIWIALSLSALSGGTILNEVEHTWQGRFENQMQKRDYQVNSGYGWAKYATGVTMAPLMLFMPFPTMVDVDQQYNQQVVSGGNYVRNFFGGFVLLAIFSALFVNKRWRSMVLIGAFTFIYLGIISLSGFANSERFVLPALPILLIMTAEGIQQLNAKNYRYIKWWYYIVPLMSLGWVFFKLGTRNLL